MLKNLFFAALAVLAGLASAHARLNSFALPAEYGLGPYPDGFFDVNKHTWEVFTTFDSDKIFGTESPRYTFAGAEFYSSGVIEGKKVSDCTFVATFQDRGSFFGGDGYMDIYYWMPADSTYAQQAVIFGGWKYNLFKYLDLDLGGNIIFTNRKIAGPGITGFGGETSRGDFYAGFTTRELFVRPFAYVDYDFTLECLKLYTGVSPCVELEDVLVGLALESQFTFGYIDARCYAGGDKPWKNSYAYFQMEADLVYRFLQHARAFIGGGFAVNNDTNGSPMDDRLGRKSTLWVSCGLGYVF